LLRRTFAGVLPAALLSVVALAAPAAGAPAEQAALNAASFKDGGGDSGAAAADVTDVDVGNDVVAGPIVFWITLANRPDDLAGEDALYVLVDADRNPATGDETGAEYLIIVDAESVGLVRWDGADYVDVDAASLSATFFKSETSLRIGIHPSDLGGLSAFDFFILTLNGEDADVAPNGPPAWSYTLASGRPPLAVFGFALSPKAPAAGKQLTATMRVGRGDTLDVLDQGKVTCTLIVGGKAVKAARAGFTQGLPQCRWNLPKSAKGKLAKGSISVTYGGSTAKKSFSARVK
jgi:hypothetical protein